MSLLIVGPVAMVLLVRAWTWATPARVTAWADRRGLQLDAAGTAHLGHYLAVTRRSRTTGWVGALLLQAVVVTVLIEGQPVLPAAGWAAAVADLPPLVVALPGYLMGIVVGEVVLAHATTLTAPPTARLVVRDPATYTSRRAAWLRRSGAAVLLVATGTAAIAARSPSQLAPPSTAAWVAPAMAAVAAVASVVLVETARRWVATRAQRPATDAAAVADDVARADVSAALLSIQVACLLTAAAWLFETSAMRIGTAMTVLPMTAGVASGIAATAVLIVLGPRHLWIPPIAARGPTQVR